jgi:hypothetical protein
MDLMGRKMRIHNGGPFMAYCKEINKFCEENHNHPILGQHIQALAAAFDKLTGVAHRMRDQMESDPLQWASNTYPALMAFGEITMTWRLLDMGIAANRAIDKGKQKDFYTGKIMQATYFADVTLPQTLATMDHALRGGREVVDMPMGAF